MNHFLNMIIYDFLISFGVVTGASIFAGIGAIINNDAPIQTMLNISSSIKIWAVAAALGGTFDSLTAIEQGLFRGEIKSILKQAIYIVISLIGANVGHIVIHLIQRCGDIWLE